MQHMATSEIHLSAGREEPASWGTHSFVQPFAIGAMAIYSVFSVAIMIAAPEIARFALIWVLWAAVTVAAAITYEVGRHVRSTSVRAQRATSQESSLRMRRWTVG